MPVDDARFGMRAQGGAQPFVSISKSVTALMDEDGVKPAVVERKSLALVDEGCERPQDNAAVRCPSVWPPGQTGQGPARAGTYSRVQLGTLGAQPGRPEAPMASIRVAPKMTDRDELTDSLLRMAPILLVESQ